jgi:hypothetical protein
MQIRILRTVTLLLLTVMATRNTFGQTFSSGDHFFNINVYRVSDDSPQVITVVCKDGPLYVVQMQGGKILNFSVDGRNIPTDSLGRYQAVIEDIKVRVKEAEEQAKRDRAQAERDRQQAGRDREQAGRDREQAERDRLQADRNREQAEQSRLQAEQNREQAERDREQSRRNEDQVKLNRDQADRDRQQAERDREQASRDREQAERDRAQAERDRIRAEEDRKMMDSLIRDLVADGIVTDRDSIHSLKVDGDEVIVNGKRLPEALEKKYISRYVKKGFSMSYHND